jgi:hypothetical protein
LSKINLYAIKIYSSSFRKRKENMMGNICKTFWIILAMGFVHYVHAKAPTSAPTSKPATSKPSTKPTSEPAYEFDNPSELSVPEEKYLKKRMKNGWTRCILQQEGGHKRQIYYFYPVFVEKGKYIVAPKASGPNTFVLFNNTHTSKKLAKLFSQKKIVVTYYTHILGQRVLQKRGFNIMASERMWCML